MKSAFSASRVSLIRRATTVVCASALVLGGLSACSDDAEKSASEAVSSATEEAKEATSEAKEAKDDASETESEPASAAAATAQDAAGAAAEARESADAAAQAAADALAAARAKVDESEYTMAEVKEHNKKDDCWTVIDGDVYDLTDWVGQHPGGAKNIEQLCGTDGTKKFEGHHEGDARPHSKIEDYKLGELKD